MDRMCGIDPMFVYSETPSAPMEVAYACVFDPSTAPDGYSFGLVRDRLDQRLPKLPPFRRRLLPVPLGLDHPRWVDDPEFDLDNHLHRAALPARAARATSAPGGRGHGPTPIPASRRGRCTSSRAWPAVRSG